MIRTGGANCCTDFASAGRVVTQGKRPASSGRRHIPSAQIAIHPASTGHAYTLKKPTGRIVGPDSGEPRMQQTGIESNTQSPAAEAIIRAEKIEKYYAQPS